MLYVDRLPLAGLFRSVRMLGVLRLGVVARIDNHRCPVRHHNQRRVTSSRGDRVDVQIPFLPFRKILRRLREDIEHVRKQRQCQ